MMATLLVCRLCQEHPTKALSLFSAISMKQGWAGRITSLLEVPVCEGDGYSAHICHKCKNRIESLERAAEDLVTFKVLARSAFTNPRTALKRTKETSSEVGVSPDTLRERPRSKLSRRRLEYSSTCNIVEPSIKDTPKQNLTLQGGGGVLMCPLSGGFTVQQPVL